MASSAVSRAIAVFGSSEPAPEDEGYREAEELGRLLARANRTVVTGGYGGVMEGASRGAFEAGGSTIGVVCDIFDRSPNPYLTEIVHSSDLLERTRKLIDRASGFVVCRGKAGTLAEVALLWALERAGCLGPRPVVLLGGAWGELLRTLGRCGMLDTSQIEATRVVESPADALRTLDEVAP